MTEAATRTGSHLKVAHDVMLASSEGAVDGEGLDDILRGFLTFSFLSGEVRSHGQSGGRRWRGAGGLSDGRAGVLLHRRTRTCRDGERTIKSASLPKSDATTMGEHSLSAKRMALACNVRPLRQLKQFRVLKAKTRLVEGIFKLCGLTD